MRGKASPTAKVHPTLIHAWKRAMVLELFAANQKSQEKAKEEINHLSGTSASWNAICSRKGPVSRSIGEP